MTETPYLSAFIVCPYKIRREGKKSNLILKYVTMIDPVTKQFEMMHYNDQKAMTIENLVETTWLTRYPWSIEITYDQGS